MGAVFMARQTVPSRLVAIKTLQPSLACDAEFVTRFHNEAVAAAGLNHPNLVQVYAAGHTDGIHWFAMEFVDGESVETRLKRLGKLEPAEAIAICIHVCTALEYGWRKAQLIHRDIKPDNVFLSNDGEVKLGDLGLAKSSDQQQGLTMTGASMGTPLYISPEQAEGKRDIDLRTDIYSLGATLYHLLAGAPPYTAQSAISMMMKHVGADIPDVRSVDPSLPATLAAVVFKMLQKAPENRYGSYAELIADLHAAHAALQEPRPIPTAQPAVEEAPTPAPPKAGSPLRPLLAGLVAATCLLAGLSYWALRSGTAKQSALAQETAVGSKNDAWKPLFNGNSLEGWREYSSPNPSGFSVSDGQILGTGLLLYDELFENFELELEWKVSADKGNGGLFFMVTPGEGQKPVSCLEMQLCGSTGDPKFPVGSLWGQIRASQTVAVPSSQWHSARLVVSEGQCQHWVNGTLVCEYGVGTPEAERADAKSQLPRISRKGTKSEGATPGWIGLQFQHDIAFRNIRIHVLPSKRNQRIEDKEALSELIRRLEAKTVPVPKTKIKLSRTEFTVGEWKLYLKASGRGQWKPHQQINELHNFAQTDEHPVCEVTWHQAKACCDWLSTQTGKTWRLPTDAEWSAAVGDSLYPWGKTFPPEWRDGNYSALQTGVEDREKIGSDGIRGTAPVGSFRPNSLGFYDLGGNVQEWVGDGFQNGMRTLRGCDWWKGEEPLLRSAHRYHHGSEAERSGVGFRIAQEL